MTVIFNFFGKSLKKTPPDISTFILRRFFFKKSLGLSENEALWG
jgi:hypothetical protein